MRSPGSEWATKTILSDPSALPMPSPSGAMRSTRTRRISVKQDSALADRGNFVEKSFFQQRLHLQELLEGFVRDREDFGVVFERLDRSRSGRVFQKRNLPEKTARRKLLCSFSASFGFHKDRHLSFFDNI